jgi:arylsulfatase
METVDAEFLESALDFIDRQKAADTPFFCWFNTTWMHFRVRPPEEIIGQSGRWQSEYHDAMIAHDKHAGALLDKLFDLPAAVAAGVVLLAAAPGAPMTTKRAKMAAADIDDRAGGVIGVGN